MRFGRARTWIPLRARPARRPSAGLLEDLPDDSPRRRAARRLELHPDQVATRRTARPPFFFFFTLCAARVRFAREKLSSGSGDHELFANPHVKHDDDRTLHTRGMLASARRGTRAPNDRCGILRAQTSSACVRSALLTLPDDLRRRGGERRDVGVRRAARAHCARDGRISAPHRVARPPLDPSGAWRRPRASCWWAAARARPCGPTGESAHAPLLARDRAAAAP